MSEFFKNLRSDKTETENCILTFSPTTLRKQQYMYWLAKSKHDNY